MFNEIIELVNKQYLVDNLGQQIPLTTSREVFASRKSVKQNESLMCGQIGFKADYMFVIRSEEYNDEKQVKYNGKTYDIYRTYLTFGDFLELYVGEKIGT